MDEHNLPSSVEAFFTAIRNSDSETVRALLSADRRLTFQRLRRSDWRYQKESELDAFRLLGAYIGRLTGLQYAIIEGKTGIALDIVDVTFQQGISATLLSNRY